MVKLSITLLQKMKNIIIIGTNRQDSTSLKLANLLLTKIEAKVINLSSYEPKSLPIDNIDEITNVIWIIPTYHGTFSGYSKLILDACTDQALKSMALSNNYIVSSSPFNIGAEAFERPLKYAINYQFKGKKPEIKLQGIVMGKDAQYGEISDDYLDLILSTINDN